MSRWVAALRLVGVGFFIGGCIAGGALLGWWLGGKKPLFMIVGLFIGLVVAGFDVKGARAGEGSAVAGDPRGQDAVE